MKILYIFPHPDDESFGPAAAIWNQVQQGHRVFLLTLTKGGATKVRFEYGYSVEDMGNVRYAEMQEVAKVLQLANLTVLNLPDSGLKEIDPRIIEQAVEEHIKLIQPGIVVTYPVHGVSGFHDHLVTHAVVKRVFVTMQEQGCNYLKRLAFFTVSEEMSNSNNGIHRIQGSKPHEIDCIVQLSEADLEKMNRALDCYKTYAGVIDQSFKKSGVFPYTCFEIFNEQHQPPLTQLTQNLP
ncbi:PIG-L family deacetylase [Sphingobacteriales bacterium UPWRP_1]|nr:PIG-L family deacetylase [Sphingobacteriales bacterium UPWRP_1]